VTENTTDPRQRPNRVSGLQAAQLALASQLRAWSEHFSPREYETLLDLHLRFLQAERERVGSRWLEEVA
jgi:hypothetical protein